jgi:YD repeat-containing protein
MHTFHPILAALLAFISAFLSSTAQAHNTSFLEPHGERMIVTRGDDGRMDGRRLYRLADGANTLSFAYDEASRMKRVTLAETSAAPMKRTDYVFDGNGNRTKVLTRPLATDPPTAATTESYRTDYGSNQLDQITSPNGTRSFVYDARGNMQSESRTGNASTTVTALYDGHARLISLARTGEDTQGNVYNGMDQRVVVTSGTVTRRFVYDPDGRVLGEYGTSASDVIAERIWMTPEVAEYTGPCAAGNKIVRSLSHRTYCLFTPDKKKTPFN